MHIWASNWLSFPYLWLKKKCLRQLLNVTKNTPNYYSQIKEPFKYMYMFNIICLSVGLSSLSCYFNQKTLKFLCKWYSCKGVMLHCLSNFYLSFNLNWYQGLFSCTSFCIAVKLFTVRQHRRRVPDQSSN